MTSIEELKPSQDILEKGKNACKACDGYGVMTSSYPVEIDMPCFICSLNKTLDELYLNRNKWIRAAYLDSERKLILEHNERIKRCQK